MVKYNIGYGKTNIINGKLTFKNGKTNIINGKNENRKL